MPPLNKGPVGEDVIDDADHREGRDALGEADRAATLNDVGIHDELLGLQVFDVVDAGEVGVGVHLALGAQVFGIRAMPVDVVGRDVEAHRGDG